MSKIKDLPRFDRPREKLFEKGPEALKDFELLAILLRTGYKGKSAVEVAKRILDTAKLENLSKFSILDLAKLKGVGKSRASTISAGIELSKRMSNTREDITIITPEDVAKVVSYLKGRKKEYLVALYLDARNQLINSQEISMGSLTENIVHPREVFSPALKYHAAQVILVHNHPSGKPDPSENDLVITRRLVEAGKILGIEVSEHIIISNNGFFSFKDKGLV